MSTDHQNLRLPYPRSLARDPCVEGSVRRALSTPPDDCEEGGVLGFSLIVLVVILVYCIFSASLHTTLHHLS